MLSTKIKRAGALLSLLLTLCACSIGPPQPQTNMVFGPASPKAVVILSDKRTLSLLLVNLKARTAVRGGYLIEPKRVEGATTRFDFRIMEPGDYALVYAQQNSLYGHIEITCYAQAAPVYHVEAGNVTVLPTDGILSPSPMDQFKELQSQYRNIEGEAHVAWPVATVLLADHVGYWAGCQPGKTFTILEQAPEPR